MTACSNCKKELPDNFMVKWAGWAFCSRDCEAEFVRNDYKTTTKPKLKG